MTNHPHARALISITTLLCAAAIAGGPAAIAAPRKPSVPQRTAARNASAPPLECSGTLYTWGLRNLNQDLDSDFDKNPHKPGDQSSAIQGYEQPRPPASGETRARGDFSNGFWLGTAGHGAGGDADRDRLYNQFLSGNGSMISFSSSSTMSQIIGTAPAFTAFAAKFENQVKLRISNYHSLCGFDGNGLLAQDRPGYFNDPLYAHAVLGGYQRLEATIVASDSGITIRYKIYDHFGAGMSDAASSLPGLPGLYYLQHYAGRWGSKYTPFAWWVEITHNLPPAPRFIAARHP